ncbi:hypothetical protein ACOME3_004568 [Neoechinorhynchus agilis]
MLLQSELRVGWSRLFICRASTLGTRREFTKSQSSEATKTSAPGDSGRFHLSENVVTVFGGSGFIGRSLISRLCKLGCQVKVPYRGELYHLRSLRVSGELGQVQFCPFNAKDVQSIARAMKYSNVVVNLIGRSWETSNFPFDAVHVDVAQTIAREAQRLGVQRLIHFSSLNASLNPPRFYTRTGSRFLISKAKGEEAVLSEFPEACIVRPADVYGWNDHFIAYYNHMFRRSITNRFIPLYARGRRTTKIPISIHNVIDGIVELCDRDCNIANGQIVEFYGPYGYSLHDIIKYLITCLRRKSTISWMLPTTLAKVFITSKLMTTTREINIDRLEREFTSDTITSPYSLQNLIADDRMLSLPHMWPHVCRPYCTGLIHGETFENQPEPECLHAIPVSEFCNFQKDTADEGIALSLKSS